VSRFAEALQRTFGLLAPQRQALLEAWTRALAAEAPGRESEARSLCASSLDRLFDRIARGELDGLLRDEAGAAAEGARANTPSRLAAASIRTLDRCCLPFLLAACPERDALADSLIALAELGALRLEALLRAQEQESSRRLLAVEDEASRAEERALDLARANDSLRRSELRSQHRAEQIALLSSVIHRIAGIHDAERLMEEAVRMVQVRMGHTYVAIVVLDDEGVLVGRWAGRQGVARRSAGRAQGPPGGIIGRAIRRKAPQVVPDVARDPDYHADVPGTRSEMVVPLMEAGETLGALDFQSERPAAFDLDDVVAAEVLAEFLMVAFRSARQHHANAPGRGR
jgi:GAF domain-containing protein